MAEYVFRLYVSPECGPSPAAVQTIHEMLTEVLPNGYAFDIIDINEQPEVAFNEKVLAVPLLARISPPPLRRVLGGMSDPDRLRAALGLGYPQTKARV